MEKTNVSQPSEQYASFGLGRRNVFMWLASLFMLLSGALRIVYYSSPVEDAEGVGSTAFVLFFVVLPVVFCLWYAAALISKGSERLFTTCTPVFFGTAFLIYRACILFKSGAFGFNSGILLAANIVFCCMLYFIYRFAINGKIRCFDVGKPRFPVWGNAPTFSFTPSSPSFPCRAGACCPRRPRHPRRHSPSQGSD